ncbi:uncharacterized protein LOC132743269 [Ruditapes philippinarum]|uniref:uncharacterized protein LOC132743269 n=1 Tax=Ruditapes philippinarum TaxID=129788 RepID=UPI00295B2430|nr:uncharacterized protein LOC132743269 [Ruditapes philippinarum]
MATLDQERYLRNLLLLGEGGMFVLRCLVDQEVIRSGQTLEELLLRNQLRFKNILEEQRQVLYPSPGTANADVNTWDVSLILLVVKKLFYQVLPHAIVSDIDALKGFRNSIQAHPCNLSMDETEFSENQQRIQNLLRNIAGYVNESVEGLIRKSEKGSIDITSAIQRIHETQAFSTSLKHSIEKQFEHVKAKLSSLEKCVTTIKEGQDETSQRMSKLEGKIDKIVWKIKHDFTKDLDTIVQVKCGNEEKQKKAIDLLFEFVKIIQDHQKFDNDEIRKMIEQRVVYYGELTVKLFDDLIDWFSDINQHSDGIGEARVGSILIPIFCSSVTRILALLKYMISSHCKQRLSSISSTVSTLLGFPCSLSWKVEPTSLQSAISSYLYSIGTECSKKEIKKLVLPVKVSDMEGLTNVWKLFGGEERNNHIEKVSNTLSKIFGENIRLQTYVDKDQFLEKVVKETGNINKLNGG